MKKVQSVLCALALAISLSSTVFSQDIQSDKPASDNISTVNTNGIIVGDVFTWGDVSGVIVNILGWVHG